MNKSHRELLEEYVLGHDRYEYIRTLSPLEFREIYFRNLTTGVPFDTIVDELIAKKRSENDN